MSAENQVIVLFVGYSENVVNGVMDANCTSILIRGKETLTIVDTRTAWDGDEIVAGNAYCTLIQSISMAKRLNETLFFLLQN